MQFIYPVFSPSGVTSLNTQTGAMTIVAGTNITVTPGVGTLTVAAAGGSTSEIEYRTVSAGESAAKQLTLVATPVTPGEVILGVAGAPTQVYGTDFTVTGNILSWSGTSLDGILTTGDQLLIEYLV